MGEIKNQNSGPSSEEGTDPPKSKRLYQVWKGRNQLKVREAEKLKGNVFRPPNTPTRCSTVDNIVKNANLLLLSMTKTRNATWLVAPAIVVGLGALTHTLGTVVPVIGASGFATVAAATAIGTVVGSFR